MVALPSPSTHSNSKLNAILKQLTVDLAQRNQHEVEVYVILDFLIAWFKENLQFKVSRSYPNVESTLERGSGDCNELSLLFIEILRSLGFKAEMVFGIVHVKGQQWAYHAWSRLWVKHGWIYIDPSRYSYRLSAKYIAFAHGDLRQQSQLDHLVGHIRGRVLAWSK